MKKKVIKKSKARKITKKLKTKKITKTKDLKNKLNLPNIAVIGIGGSGGNAVNYMIKKDVKNVKFISINTDIQDLNQSKAGKKIKIGESLTNGGGSGMNPEIGKKSALEASDDIAQHLKDVQMIFLTGGMGGGTGTGATPVVAQIAQDLNILTVAIITKPFSFEGKKRMQLAEEGIEELSKYVDSYIVIENDKILETANEDSSIEEAFMLSDEVLKQAVEGISDLITKAGMINIDYADVQSVLKNSKLSLIGIGLAKGSDRAMKATSAAINSPLIDISTKGAKSILFSISTSGDLKMSEVSEIAQNITEEVSENALIKFGTTKNQKLKKGELKITVIASNFTDKSDDVSNNQNNDATSLGMIFKEKTKIETENKNKEIEDELQDEKEGKVTFIKWIKSNFKLKK